MVSKHDLWNLPTKITICFKLIYLFNVLFNSNLSYFAKPNFIIYDEWFDNNLEKTKLDVEIKKTKTITNIHDFFYTQSNCKVGGSENNTQLDIKLNEQKLITYKNVEKNTNKVSSVSNNNFRFFKKISKSNLKFAIKKKLIYSLSILGFIFIFWFLLFYIPQYKKNYSNLTTKSFVL